MTFCKTTFFRPLLAVFTLMTVLLIPALSFAQELEPIKSKQAPLSASVSYQVSNAYRIGVGDVLSLAVYPQDEFSANELLVRSDGSVTFPRIGEFSAYGKSVKELTDEVNGQLNRSLRNHAVTISVTSTRPAIFYLTGAVVKQGPFQMSTNARDLMQTMNESHARRADQVLSNVLSNAGGVSLNADLSQVRIKHRDSEEFKTVNLWKVIREGSANDDPWLDPGDTVFVPELPNGAVINDDEFKVIVNSVLAPHSFPVRVIGEVHTPALVRLEGDSPFLSSAIAQSGGFSPAATKNAVAVRRFVSDNHYTTLFVNPEKMDFVLRPNDIVYVGEAKFYKAGRFMERASAIMSPFTTAALATFGYSGWANARK